MMLRSTVSRCGTWRKALGMTATSGSVGSGIGTQENAMSKQLIHRSRYHHLASSADVAGASSSFAKHPRHLQISQRQQRRTVFIQTESTPNPESLKFVPSGKAVLETEDGTGYYVTKTDPQEAILRSPLAKELFRIEGVKAVYFGADFVTVTKVATEKWQLLRPLLFSALMDFFETGKPVLLEKPEMTDTTILEDDDEIVAMIKELIEARIRPAVQEDGGDIRYVSFDEETGMVTVSLAGSCVGCPSSSVTLKQGVENMLMHYIPEVTAVQALDDDPDKEACETHSAEPVEEEPAKQKTYEERLKAAGIPFSD
jgi:NFU1 iron-sulfur cluster scaffold homolog, mitochondrial